MSLKPLPESKVIEYKPNKEPDDSNIPASEDELSLDLANMLFAHRIVVLKERDSDRVLPIWIGPFEADAIVLQLKEKQVKRPLTFDLTKTLLDFGEIKTERVVISRLHETTYYSNVIVRAGDKTGEIDSRPSDAINLALRLDVPIFVSDELMEQAGMPNSETKPKEGFERRSLLDETINLEETRQRFHSLLQDIEVEIDEEAKLT
ncbi:bifunctional nuclease family protein [Chloroflexi bacterium TSY]|nr:bifunctional nuclease family protein [Chloroflexi bacterium TSY]